MLSLFQVGLEIFNSGYNIDMVYAMQVMSSNNAGRQKPVTHLSASLWIENTFLRVCILDLLHNSMKIDAKKSLDNALYVVLLLFYGSVPLDGKVFVKLPLPEGQLVSMLVS